MNTLLIFIAIFSLNVAAEKTQPKVYTTWGNLSELSISINKAILAKPTYSKFYFDDWLELDFGIAGTNVTYSMGEWSPKTKLAVKRKPIVTKTKDGWEIMFKP